MIATSTPWWARTEALGPWFKVGGDEVRLLRDGVEALPAMLAAIAAAEREVLLEMYWVAPDAVGTRFRDALVDKARAGVTVRVIYDAVGSLTLTPSFWAPLVDAGGEVREYHPLSPFRPAFDLARIEERNHRKILVTDGGRGFTGGINLARPWLPLEDGGEAWRDDMIEVIGHAAAELRTLFYKTWRRMGIRRLPHDPLGSLSLPKDLVPLSRRPLGRVYVLASLRRSRRNLRREYLTRLNRAERSIEIANSYFIPDRSVRSALYRAVLRGVRVRVLVPSKSDVAVVQFALEALYESLLRNGVEIYCHSGPMMHAKTAIIDDRFATIGSYNLDERSRTKNLEVNVAVEDAAFATYVRKWFDRDLESSTHLDLYEWRARPLARRGAEYMAYALRKLW
ncbi:MAG: cardiolipin synthase B [Labilithrix sp.]|nr:cardiolipin synthase B [Labilithrix sp.]MCW5837932.1 cardiolipin synthase B [Labilithrix sp.]